MCNFLNELNRICHHILVGWECVSMYDMCVPKDTTCPTTSFKFFGLRLTLK